MLFTALIILTSINKANAQDDEKLNYLFSFGYSRYEDGSFNISNQSSSQSNSLLISSAIQLKNKVDIGASYGYTFGFRDASNFALLSRIHLFPFLTDKELRFDLYPVVEYRFYGIGKENEFFRKFGYGAGATYFLSDKLGVNAEYFLGSFNDFRINLFIHTRR